MSGAYRRDVDLTDPLLAFIRAVHPADARAVLEEHPDLLSDAGLYLLARIVDSARREHRKELPLLEQRQSLLKGCCDVGVDNTFTPEFKVADRTLRIPFHLQ